MAIVQWVNLEKEEIYAKDADVGSIDRCGKLSITITCANDKAPVDFKSKVTPDAKNATYSADEESRNPNFKMTRGEAGTCEEKEIKVEETYQLPAAGGNKYKIEAKDSEGNVVSSTDVETWRKLYYQMLVMDDTNGSVGSASLAKMEKHSEKHFIKVQQSGTKGKIPYRKCLAMQEVGGNTTQFGNDVGAAFNLDAALKKVGIAAVFSDYISDMIDHDFVQSVAIGSANPSVVISATEVTIIGDRWLWHGLDDTEDTNKKWFIDGQVQFNDPTTSTTMSYTIPRANAELAGAKRFTYGGFHQIKFKREGDLDTMLKQKQGVLEFSIQVNIVDGWTNGFSWAPSGNNLITTAKRVEWEDMPAKTTEYTWNHEIGHRFGMVAFGHKKTIAGYKKLPDGPSTLYGENRGVNDKTHSGPHCEKGATYTVAGGWTGTPGCVMFGANGIGNNHAPKEYCSTCEPIVRKLDLS